MLVLIKIPEMSKSLQQMHLLSEEQQGTSFQSSSSQNEELAILKFLMFSKLNLLKQLKMRTLKKDYLWTEQVWIIDLSMAACQTAVFESLAINGQLYNSSFIEVLASRHIYDLDMIWLRRTAIWEALQKGVVVYGAYQGGRTCLIIIILFRSMGKRRSGKKENGDSKRSYARISLKRRKMLINMVYKEGFSIARTIKKLSLKLTTARFILQKYKESGTFPMKQFRRNARMLRDLPEQASSPPPPPIKQEEESAEPAVKVEAEELPEYEQALEEVQMAPYVYYYYIPCVFPS